MPIQDQSNSNPTLIKDQFNSNQRPIQLQSNSNPTPIQLQSDTNQRPILCQYQEDNPKTDLFVVTDFLTMAEGASSDYLQSNANPMSMPIRRQCQSNANPNPMPIQCQFNVKKIRICLL